MYSEHTGQSVEVLDRALERDNYMTAEEARRFGLIDTVLGVEAKKAGVVKRAVSQKQSQ